MKRVENLNAPSLNGWIIAAGAGVLAFVLSLVVGGFDFTTSGFFAVMVTGIAGLVIGMPWGAADRIPKPEVDHDAAHGAAAIPAAAPAAAAPLGVMAEAAPMMAAAPVAPAPAAAPVAAMAPMAPVAAMAPVAEAATPAPALKAAAAVSAGGTKPAGLAAARDGVADDLKVIEGIGPAMERLLNENGIFHLDQIASWGAAEVEWMDGNLKGFKGRVTRDKWVAQARLIGEVGVAEFLRRAKTNSY